MNNFFSKYQQATEEIEVLGSIKSRTAQLKKENKLGKLNSQKNYDIGYYLGQLKAELDTMPDDVAIQQRLNGVEVIDLIKIMLDELIIQPIEQVGLAGQCTTTFSIILKPDRVYDKVEERFPLGTWDVVYGFAMGYSKKFQEVAYNRRVNIQVTPVKADILANLEYFFNRQVDDYCLEGNKYSFLYDSDFEFIIGTNRGVYDELKKKYVQE